MGTARNKSGEVELPLRITLLQPPSGVRFCLQSGRDELVQQTTADGTDLSLDLTVRAVPNGTGVRFLGPFTQGPPAARFLYICSGTSAGQLGSPWTRRAKVGLGGITWALVEELGRSAGRRLEASITGTARDGGPVCATVPLLGGGWRIAD